MEEFNLDKFIDHTTSYEVRITWNCPRNKPHEKFSAPTEIYECLSKLNNFRGMEVLKHGK